MSRCIENKEGRCSATRPRISDIDLSWFPEEIKTKIHEKNMGSNFKRCSYCGTVWAEDFNHKTFRTQTFRIGTRSIDDDIMTWFI